MNQTPTIDKTDIATQSWVDVLPRPLRPYLILMRADRPIGTWLLLFPCWWTLVLANPAGMDLYFAALFGVGAFIMRGAGCVMNDLADRDFDGQVARTKTRPIPNGDVSPKQAAVFMGMLCLLGLVILLQFNAFTVYLGIASLALVFIYPFCKRWTYWPQAILGLTFNWGALMGWAAMEGSLGWPAVCFYLAGLFWTLGYDTVYAHQDKDDDEMIGIKSTALRLGEATRSALWVFYGLTIALMTLGGYGAGVGDLFYAGMALAAAHLVWQILKLDIHDPRQCLIVFKSNKWFGWLVLLALALGKVSL